MNPLNEKVSKYISEAPEAQRNMMEELRKLIQSQVPTVVESFKWSRPVFSTDSDFAYFKSTKGYLTLGIFKFEKITTNAHLLEGTGKDMRHIKIKSLDNLLRENIRSFIDQITK
jgi:hypothetical protein